MIDKYTSATDWAYKILLLAYREHGYNGLCSCAEQFRPYVLEDCYMQALVDIDWKVDHDGAVRDACKKLTEGAQ